MANEDTILREVDQELAEDRQWVQFRKYGPAAIAAAIAIVVGVGGWQGWNAYKDNIAGEQALEFRNALDLLGEDQTEGEAALSAISDKGAGGYGVLAELQRAASLSRGGNRTGAVSAFEEVYKNGAAPKRIRELARLRAAYLSLVDGRDVVMAHLGDLQTAEGSFSYHADEVAGLAAIEAKDYQTAVSIFRQLSIDLGAPAALRTRAEDFAALAEAGRAGVNITGETRLDDILDVLGGTLDADENVVSDEGASAVSDVQAIIDDAQTEAENVEAAVDDIEAAVVPEPEAASPVETEADAPEEEANNE